MSEHLISDTELDKIIREFESKFSVGIIQDFQALKTRGEKFLEAAYSIRSGGILGRFRHFLGTVKKKEKAQSFEEFLFDDAKYRILLGTGVELIVKAAFVKEGYAINCYNDTNKERRLIRKGKPEKFDLVKETDLSLEKTHNISFLVKHTDLLFPPRFLTKNEFVTYIRKGLEIARVWRNKEVHISSGYHEETVGEDEAIKTALLNIYGEIFKDRTTIERILKIKE